MCTWCMLQLRVSYLNRRDYVELATAYRLEKELRYSIVKLFSFYLSKLVLGADCSTYIHMAYTTCRPAVEAIGRGLFALVPKQALHVLTAEVGEAKSR